MNSENYNEKMMKITESQYKTIVENIHEVIILTYPDSTVFYVSPVCKTMLGYEVSDILGSRPWIIPSKDSKKLFEAHQRALDGESGIDLDYQITTKEGVEKWVSHSWKPVMINNKVAFIVSIIRDITEKKNMEDEIKATNRKLVKNLIDLQKTHEELTDTQDQLVRAEKMRAMGVLSSGVAHEVKNPLGIILQGINYLTKKIESPEKDIEEVLGMMKAGVKRADNIICGLVDFSRTSAPEMKMEDINAIVANSISLIQHKLDKDAIELVQELGDDLPKISINSGNIEQIFVNFFINAMHAMPEGGKIVIRTYKSKLDDLGLKMGKRKGDSFKESDSVIVAEVEDTGFGISKEHIEKVLEPFFTTKGPREGAGLGLAVSKNIMDTHKGIMNIKSEKGVGTTIRACFRIPESNNDDNSKEEK